MDTIILEEREKVTEETSLEFEINLLRDRARRYAIKPDEESRDPGECLDVLMFRLGGQQFGILTSYVVEVNQFSSITPLPRTPETLVGVTNFQSRILPVYNLLCILDFAETGIVDAHHIVVVKADDVEIGFIADKVDDIREIAVEDLQPVSGDSSRNQLELIQGITVDQLLLINLPGLLSGSVLIVNHSDE